MNVTCPIRSPQNIKSRKNINFQPSISFFQIFIWWWWFNLNSIFQNPWLHHAENAAAKTALSLWPISWTGRTRRRKRRTLFTRARFAQTVFKVRAITQDRACTPGIIHTPGINISGTIITIIITQTLSTHTSPTHRYQAARLTRDKRVWRILKIIKIR